jgi:hypothetical protein
LRAQLKDASEEAKAKVQKQIDELSKKRDDFARKIEEVEKSTGEAWKDLRAGLARASVDFSKGVSDARDKLKK